MVPPIACCVTSKPLTRVPTPWGPGLSAPFHGQTASHQIPWVHWTDPPWAWLWVPYVKCLAHCLPGSPVISLFSAPLVCSAALFCTWLFWAAYWGLVTCGLVLTPHSDNTLLLECRSLVCQVPRASSRCPLNERLRIPWGCPSGGRGFHMGG